MYTELSWEKATELYELGVDVERRWEGSDGWESASRVWGHWPSIKDAPYGVLLRVKTE